MMFVVLRPASYDDRRECVDFGEVRLFVGPQFVITVRHGDVPDLSEDRDALGVEPQFLRRRGPVEHERELRERHRQRAVHPAQRGPAQA
ncbi:hypothetical protein ACIBRY_36810 [Streptomyces anulatus]